MRIRWVNLIMLVALLVGLPLFSATAAPAPSVADASTPPGPAAPAPNQIAEDALSTEDLQALLPTKPADQEAALSKLHPSLRDLAQTGSANLQAGALKLATLDAESIIIQVIAKPGTDLKAFFEEGKLFARPALGKAGNESQVFLGAIKPNALMKIASLGAVQAVLPITLERNGYPDNYPADDTATKPSPEDWDVLRVNADKLRADAPAWSDAKAYGDGLDVTLPEKGPMLAADPHNVEEAWRNGYTGKGVTVAVLDDGIDTAHPDLMGTQRIYSSTVNSQYNGWPVAFSPISMLLYAFQEIGFGPYVSYGYPGIHYVDTSATPILSSANVGRLNLNGGVSEFDYTPLIDFGTPGYEHTYTISDTMTLSGVVHVGTHPDVDLRDFLWGELVAVLVCDPNTSGVYDTVYVDLNNDYDFRDEKPLTRANVNNLSTYNNMVSYRDLDGDGLADISGGALYFIADGVNVIPGSDWLYGAGPGFMLPENGDLVAFSGASFGYDYSHGTQCASAIAGQGVVDAMIPEFQEGKQPGAVYGVAPDAKLVDVSDIYWNFDSSKVDAYLFVALGYDGIDQTGWSSYDNTIGNVDTDPIQVVSNSYGSSNIDYDGWDYDSHLVSQLMRWWAPYQQYTFSTGNGGPGYGTTSQPSPDTGIMVGASTEYSVTGWDSITSTQQINMNDVTPFSNRGPGATGVTGVDVVANGAYAPGDEALNYYAVSMWGEPNGNYSWDSWGGTSRSSPVAAGVLALIYDAFRQSSLASQPHSPVAPTWPSGIEAKIALMSGATDLNYDTFSQGAGSVNAGASTAIAASDGGLVAFTADIAIPDLATNLKDVPPFQIDTSWEPGDYRGEDYPGFAHVMSAGETDSTTIVAGAVDGGPFYTVARDVELKLIGQWDKLDVTITPEMVAGEYAYGSANRDNFYKAFQYFIPITAVAGMDDSWYNLQIPEGTDLMVVRMLFPFEEYDADGDYAWDNRYSLMVYNWTDVNNNGLVWDDKDGNGTVNFINRQLGVDSPTWDLIDGGMDLRWDDPRTELDQWEYARFSYNRPAANRVEMWVSNPLERMQDGLFLGLRHLPTDRYTGPTHIQFRFEFYQEQDCPWLSLSSSAPVQATGLATNEIPVFSQQGPAFFTAHAEPPADMNPGVYQAAIEIDVPDVFGLQGLAPVAKSTIIIPVAMTIVEDLGQMVGSNSLQFGGYETYLDSYNAGRLYNNGCVRGQFDWTWREESGDWRFFFQDIPPVTPNQDENLYLIVRDEWVGPAPYNDIDTVILGPTASSLGTGFYDWPEPDYFGPFTLETIASSPVVRSGRSTWMFNTSSGANEDWVGAEIVTGGLYGILQHHVLADGLHFDVVFTKTLGLMATSPDSFVDITYKDWGYLGQETLISTLPFDALTTNTYGLSIPEQYEDVPVGYAGDDIEWVGFFEVEHCGLMAFEIDSADVSDLDLYLFYLGPTGVEVLEQRGSSAGGASDEYIAYLLPEDGVWAIAVDNYSGPAGHFDLRMLVVQGHDIAVSNAPVGALPPLTPASFDLDYTGAAYLGDTGLFAQGLDIAPYRTSPKGSLGTAYVGWIGFGPSQAPLLATASALVLRLPDPHEVSLKVQPERFCPGYNLEYTFVMTNTSNIPLVNVVVSNTVPTKMAYYIGASGSTGVTYAFDAVTNTTVWNKAQLDPGEVMVARVTLHPYSSLPNGYALDNTFVYDAAVAPPTLQADTKAVYEKIGPREETVTAIADIRWCGTSPTPTPTHTPTVTPSPTATATPTATVTPTATPIPENFVLLPLIVLSLP
jgi:uncharacterized repeat protein (TIGR01451 family)